MRMYRRVSRFVVFLIALLGSGQALATETLETQERALLHRRLDLSTLQVLGTGSPRPVPVPRAALLVLHLWAVHCAPCVAELPLVARIVRGWRAEPAVAFLIVADPPAENDVAQILARYRGEGPPLRTADDRVRRALGTGTVPLTLLLDQDLVVREAFVGALGERGPELAAAVARLLKVLPRAERPRTR